MAWDSKFIGGHINVGDFGGCQIEVLSKTDSEKKYLYNGGIKAIDAWWQDGGVAFQVKTGSKYIYKSPTEGYVNL